MPYVAADNRNPDTADTGDFVNGTRVCIECRRRKPMSEFYGDGKVQRKRRSCRECLRAKAKARREAGGLSGGCNINDCGKPTLARQMCARHYRRWYSGRPLVPGEVHPRDGENTEHRRRCSVQTCDRFAEATIEFCGAHYQRVQKYGDVRADAPVVQRGAGRYLDPDGYVVIRAEGHPNGGKNGSMFEHTRVMSTTIGRPLLPLETVHHRNGVRDDNRPENLELWSGAHPRGARVADHIRWANEIIERYGKNPMAWEGSDGSATST